MSALRTGISRILMLKESEKSDCHFKKQALSLLFFFLHLPDKTAVACILLMQRNVAGPFTNIISLNWLI